MLTLAWPSLSLTTFGLMPVVSMSVTAIYLHVTDSQQRKVYGRAWEGRDGQEIGFGGAQNAT